MTLSWIDIIIGVLIGAAALGVGVGLALPWRSFWIRAEAGGLDPCAPLSASLSVPTRGSVAKEQADAVLRLTTAWGR